MNQHPAPFRPSTSGFHRPLEPRTVTLIPVSSATIVTTLILDRSPLSSFAFHLLIAPHQDVVATQSLSQTCTAWIRDQMGSGKYLYTSPGSSGVILVSSVCFWRCCRVLTLQTHPIRL
ncbi:hypothetical protein OG21DRAFT_306449 [Imleria badia]|nr:hypothetical protein OG21DRAFT_306449 [Imleria badia]